MYSTPNEKNLLLLKDLLELYQNKTYRNMTSLSKNMYIDKLDDIVNKYNKTYHITIKMKTVDIKSSTYVHASKEIND